jgi:hypothetical protein
MIGEGRSLTWECLTVARLTACGHGQHKEKAMAILQSNLSSMTTEQLREYAARLEAKLAVTRNAKLSMKVSEKGALSVYGLGRFPVTLYRGQWEKLLDSAADIRQFIKANTDTLSVKE